MNRSTLMISSAVIVVVAAVAAGTFMYLNRNSGNEVSASMHEGPVSGPGTGEFGATINERAQEIRYTLSYQGLEGEISQAHIHAGVAGQGGSIVVFLCANTNKGPAGTQPCPPAPATIEGIIRSADIIGQGEGFTKGNFTEFVNAVRNGTTYVNVHSSVFPGGELWGQLGK